MIPQLIPALAGGGYAVAAGNRQHYPRRRTSSASTARLFTDRWHKSPPVDIQRIEAVFHGGYFATGGSAGMTALGNDYLAACAVQYPTDQAPQVSAVFRFNGAEQFTVPNGGSIIASATVAIPANTPFRLRTWIAPVSGSAFLPYGVPCMGQSAGHLSGFPSGATDRSNFNAAQADETQSNVDVAANDSNDAAYEPILIGYASGQATTWAIFGDSITYGALDVGSGSGGGVSANAGDERGNAGWWPRAIESLGDQYINFGVSASHAGDWAASSDFAFQTAARVARKAVIALGTNYLTTAEQILTDLQTLVTRAHQWADDVVVPTLPPRTSGTYDSLAGQTVDATRSAVYNAVNASLLMTGLTGARIVDLRSLVQDSTETDKWRVDGGAWTGDGIHPSLYGIAQAAPALSALL